jgi:hypothetical protein
VRGSAQKRITSPLSSYASNTESKRLMEYEYGAEMRKEHKPVTQKCN